MDTGRYGNVNGIARSSLVLWFRFEASYSGRRNCHPAQCGGGAVLAWSVVAPSIGPPGRMVTLRAWLDLAPSGKVYASGMGHDGYLIGELAERSGVSRRALRLYEARGILAPPRRTPSGYRVYPREALDVLTFVIGSRRLGPMPFR
jgi:hypothetical protein